MLAILTSHPIQYQAPIWRALAERTDVPFETWFLTNHGLAASRDAEFGAEFQWDVDLIEGYPHEFLRVQQPWDLRRFRGVRLAESLPERLQRTGVKALWIEGWRLKPFWQAAAAAKRQGIDVWLRGESNDLKRDPPWKSLLKRPLLGRFFRRVDRFLTIGSANRRLYEGYGVPPTAIRSAPYCVDNDRFAAQAAELFPQRAELRRRWHIPDEAFCVLFCGKFIAKKRPLEMLQALDMIGPKLDDGRPVHVLFVGSGELGGALRTSCRVVFDADSPNSANPTDGGPAASFAGFMNQSQIAAAYVAADLLVLPSDFGETWGLVVNEAMACGTPAAVSDQCGCAEDLPAHLAPELVFHCGDAADMARAIQFAAHARWSRQDVQRVADRCHLRRTVDAAAELYRELLERR